MKSSTNFADLSSDGYYVSRMPYYAALYPVLREAAREHGYALAVHGSLTKDLDVVAVPWVEDAADFDTLVRALVKAAGGVVAADAAGHDTTHQPHGRLSVAIAMSNGGYVDLSVVPRSQS